MIYLEFEEPPNPQWTNKKKNLENRQKNYSKWTFKGSNIFVPSDNSTTVDKVHPGVYDIKINNELGYYLLKNTMNLDDLFELPIPEMGEILEDIRTFWGNKELFKKYGYAYKRGILLHGPPGNGKTSIINLLVKELIEKHQGVVFTIKDSDDLENYCNFIPEYFRDIEEQTQILCIIEDIDGLVEDSDDEKLLLNVLDGIEQMENVVYIGTTNYPENLKERVLNRPSRFDRRYEISMPTPEVRKFYFEKKLMEEEIKDRNIDIAKWVKDTEGFSMSHLSDLVKSVVCLGNDYDRAIRILKGMEDRLDSTQYKKKGKKLGFQ